MGMEKYRDNKEDKDDTWHFRTGEDDFVEVRKYVSPQYQEYRYAVLSHHGNTRGFLGNNYTEDEVQIYINMIRAGSAYED